ncbi:hypothetical protein DESC_800041 [Desulfosarcina cetonica]|uniref:TetR/AcrR family transcriptional regulator n=1 Tax=Desulfosarcina cetonica TaxID=90730 RepID=UPI0006D153A2|nr:TetR/AcrR family transcriptional regulator [Desulfosarcina cetonica]VTR70427.1 hypothetical protein DESC_800041 [Desulfosarcina cetonica]
MSRKDIKAKRQKKIKHILEKATEAFADKGYSGVSTNEIADLAGISKRSMYYYMGDKDTLYSSVINEILEVGGAFLAKKGNNWDQLTSSEKLHYFIKSVAQIGKNNTIHSIVVRELLSGGEFLPEDFITRSMGLIVDFFRDILDEGIEKKEFHSINPLIGALMILSFFVYWKMTIPHIQDTSEYYDYIKIFGVDVSDALIDEVHGMFYKLLTTE